jgi:sensor histidine kinase YesM
MNPLLASENREKPAHEKTPGEFSSGPATSGSLVLNLFHVILLCAVIASLITVFTSTAYVVVNFVMSFSMGLCIFFVTVFLNRLFKPTEPRPLALISFFGLLAGIFFGMNLGAWVLRNHFFPSLVWEIDFFKSIVICMIASSSATYFFYSLRRSRLDRARIEEERFRRLAMEKQALEAKLKMLQAQIEPHFLFNTLSNVISLIDTQPARGKDMLLNLTNYLRTSLARTLPDTTTLGQEMSMVRAYLDIQKIRMDERLHFTIDLPESLGHLPFPPMLLQPLVENAIKHGLEPVIEGGEIVINAREDHKMLRVEVMDTGFGLNPANSAGVGLANIRERLRLLYGDKGRLILEENKPRGLRAMIEVPIHEL